MKEMGNNQRIAYFDFLRGVAIIMVVGIHAFSQFTVGQVDYDPLSIVLRQMFNCGVPVFFALSGFFMAGKNVQDKHSYAYFCKKQLPRVYLPVLFWSIPLALRSIYNGEDLATSLLLFFACGYSIYYFVAAIIQLYVFLPVLQRISVKMGG